MIILNINNERIELRRVGPSWIKGKLQSLINQGQMPRIRVFIEPFNINMVLSSGWPSTQKAATRQVRQEENQIFDLWDRYGLGEKITKPEQLLLILNHIKNLA